MISGSISSDGKILRGEGFTMDFSGTPGVYTIRYKDQFDRAPIVTATIAIDSWEEFNAVLQGGNTSIAVSCGSPAGFNVITTLGDECKPMDFTFIAV